MQPDLIIPCDGKITFRTREGRGNGDAQVGRLAAILRRYVDGRPRIFVGLEPIGRDDPDFCQWIPAADVISCG
jgi:hypothetical protein